MDNELHNLFMDELSDTLNAEQQLAEALPELAAAAHNEELREAFESHLEDTEIHISRLEEVVEQLDEKIRSKKCPAMEGIIREGKQMIDHLEDSPAVDAALIATAQKAGHYEMASYGCLCNWAERMGYDEVLALLQDTLDEEKLADERLTEIANSWANEEAEVFD
jgi:ferritin-like metal-binding protein YciE